jgi:hypothetical protein
VIIQATVHHHAVQPGFEARIAAKLLDAGQKLYKRVLRDIHRRGRIAGIPQRDGIHPVLMRFKEHTEGVVVTALTGFDHCLVIHALNHAQLVR